MSKFRKLFKHDEGFTLIELLVVIAVLGILAAIAIPRISGVTDKAQLAELKATGSSVRSAIEMFIAENSTFPTDGTNLDFTGSEYGIDVNTDEYEITLAEGDGGTGVAANSDYASDYKVTIVPPYADTDDNPNVVVTPGGISVTE